MSATIIWRRAGRSAPTSSWLKLVRDVERGSEGGTEARDGDTFDGGAALAAAITVDAAVLCVSLGDGVDCGRDAGGGCGGG